MPHDVACLTFMLWKMGTDTGKDGLMLKVPVGKIRYGSLMYLYMLFQQQMHKEKHVFVSEFTYLLFLQFQKNP